MAKLTSVLIYAVLAGVLLFAGYLFFLGARNIWRGLASPHWPKAVGTVTSSETSSAESVDSNTHRASVDYSANISFRYTVNGRDYATRLLYFGQTEGSGDPTEAELRHLRYPVGAQVSISYDPGNPTIAATEPGFHAESLLLLMAGLGFGLPCVMACVIYIGSTTGAVGDNIGMAIGAGIFASIFAMLGIGALSLGLINLSRARASESWPKVPGVITYQTLDSSDEGQGATTYSTHLVFTYEVDGKKRYSNLRRFGLLAGGSQEEADAAQARYPQGTPVTVSYSPDNPNLGVLEPGIDNEAWYLPGIGVVLLLFATAVYVFIVPAVAQPFPKMMQGSILEEREK